MFGKLKEIRVKSALRAGPSVLVNARLGKAVVTGMVLPLTGQLLPAAVTSTPVDVSTITTQLVSGPASTINGEQGIANSGTYSGFTANHSYNLSYGGADDKILTVTGGGATYAASGMAVSVTARVTGGGVNTDGLWYVGSGSAGASALHLSGPAAAGFSQAFETNNLYVGADNLFSNTGNPVGDNSNVTRVDLLFGSFKASNLSAFTIFDRGAANDHDAFKIAAITGVDANGNPTHYGPLLWFSDGGWGKTNVMSPTEELILHTNNSASGNAVSGNSASGKSAPGGTVQPSDMTAQGIGGVIIPTSALVPQGTTIYGYSLFSPDVTGTDTQLTQWTNPTYFPSANSTSSGGGLDPAATAAVLYTVEPAAAPSAAPAASPVPEPASVALIAAGAALMGRRRRVL